MYGPTFLLGIPRVTVAGMDVDGVSNYIGCNLGCGGARRAWAAMSSKSKAVLPSKLLISAEGGNNTASQLLSPSPTHPCFFFVVVSFVA